MLSPLFRSCLGLMLGAAVASAQEPALKDVFAGKFLIGAALNTNIATNPQHPARALVEKHFNSISPANLLKWGPYNPEPGTFREAPVESFLGIGETHRQHILGHTLFWHQQTPKWVFEDLEGRQLTREALLARMRERVRHVAQRHGDRIPTWDVVNETYLDDGALRDSSFTKILGADFVAEAFRIAQEELPPGTELLYNDYNMFAPGKRAAVVKMIHDLRAKGLRIDGVGMQGHWRLETPAIAEIEASIVAFRDAGVKVHITELDIEVLPRDRDIVGADLNQRSLLTPQNNPYTDGLPSEIQERLARRYGEIFTLFLKHSDVIERVTFWGVTDGDSWLNNWPVRGRTNHPLLFDRDGCPKPAFYAVLAAGQAAEKKP